jgi:hypothetical protein
VCAAADPQYPGRGVGGALREQRHRDPSCGPATRFARSHSPRGALCREGPSLVNPVDVRLNRVDQGVLVDLIGVEELNDQAEGLGIFSNADEARRRQAGFVTKFIAHGAEEAIQLLAFRKLQRLHKRKARQPVRDLDSGEDER